MPYKFSRLKNGYLLLIIFAVFSLVLFASKIIFSDNTDKLETIEEKSVGDINETMDYPFEIHWDDTGVENSRPSSITYNLYNILDENTIVSTVTLNTSNADSNDSNKWNGVFTNIRKYNDDETEAEYIIKQQEISNYIQEYDLKDFKSLCVEFGDVILSKGNERIDFGKIVNNIQKMSNTHYTSEDLSNNNIYISGNKIYFIDCIYNSNYGYCTEDRNNAKLNIKRIYPSMKEDINEYDRSTSYLNRLENYTLEDYPQEMSTPVASYTWNPINTNFKGANIIINVNVNQTTSITFDKYWEDVGYESYRPDSSTFYLYQKNTDTLVATTVLTSENHVSNSTAHWQGTFNNVKKYDNLGRKIEYVVREKEIPNYVHSYDSNEGIVIKFNEQTDVAYYTALKVYYKIGSTYHSINIESESGISNDLDNKELVLTPTVPYIGGTSQYSSLDQVISYSDSKVLQELVGNEYPESSHPLPVGEMNAWHYKKTISSHTNEFVMIYRGDSWGNTFGLLIDDIYNYGNETIVTSTINLTNITIQKEWQDQGHENERPTSANMDIINPYSNQVVKTIDITSNDSINDYNWKKTVEVPKYTSEGKEIEYMVRENNTNNKYLAIYDNPNHQGLAITFSDDSDMSVKILFNSPPNRKIRHFGHDFDKSYNDTIKGHTIVVPTNYVTIAFYYNPTGYSGSFGSKLKIVNIEPANFQNVYTEYSTPSGESLLKENATYDQYLDIDDYSLANGYYYWNYEWKGSLSPIKNGTKVINKYNSQSVPFTKEYDDAGRENERPEKIRVNLYDIQDENKIVATKEVLLSDINIETNTIYSSFTIIPIYRADGSKIEYLIKEEALDDYRTVYDMKQKNGYCVVLRDDIAYTGSEYIYFYTRDENISYRISKSSLTHTYPNSFYPNNMIDKKICFGTNKDNFYMYESKQIIKDIYPTYQDSYEYYEISGNSSENPTHEEITLEEYNNLSQNTYHYLHYTWKGHANTFIGSDKIININKRTNINFVKKWEDVGFEDGRPDSITFNLYNELDENTVIATKTLTKNNQDTNNPNVWNGTFEKVLKYNEDGSIIKYIVKEEVLDKYKTEYDTEYNAICLTFGDNVFNGNDNQYVSFYIRKKSDLTKYYMLQNTNNPLFYRSDLINREICLPVFGDKPDFYIVNQTPNLDIRSIRKGHQDEFNYNLNIYSTSFNYNLAEYTNNGSLPNITDYKTIHYTWIDDDFYGKPIITNIGNMREEGYIKEFNDEGYEYNRPKEIVFGLYEENDPVPKEMMTLNTSTCINNRCNIEFKNVKDKDSDGNPISYTIKEISDYGYTVTYEDGKVINTANPIDVRFIKENPEGEQITGAKLVIYNKSGDKIKEFISSDEVTTIKLLPSEYVIKEEEVPAGYQKCEDIHIMVNGDGTITHDNNPVEVVKIVNEHTYNIKVSKTIKWEVSNDFKFEISLTNYEGTLSYTGDREGLLEFNNGKATFKLGANESITIREIPANLEYEIKELEEDFITKVIGNSKGTLTGNKEVEFNNEPLIIPIDVKFIKENLEGKVLRGATIGIYDKTGDKIEEFISGSREKELKLLVGEYEVKELVAPEGYERSKDIHIKVNRDGTIEQDGNKVEIVKIINEPIKETYNITLKKTIKGNENRDFTFEITIVGFNGSLSYTGDREGTLEFTNNKATVKVGTGQTITINNIPVNSKYTVNEIDEGYLTTIVGDKEGILNRNETIEFINTPKEIPGNGEAPIPEEKTVPTPITGIFNILSYIAGAILLILSIFLIVYAKKQVKKREL